MRLSTAQMNSVMLTSMQTSTTGVNKAYMQLSSGEKMLKPSDDPLGSVQVMMLEREQATINQFQKNISNLRGEIAQQESHLNASNNALLRIEELTDNVLNASNSSMVGRGAIADELDGLLSQLVDLVNSKTPSGDYMFSGTMTNTKPVIKHPDTDSYIYAGNDAKREVRIDESMTVPANQTAQDVFFGDSNDIFNGLNSLIKDLRDPDVTGDNLTNSVANAQNTITMTQTSINQVWTEVGAHLNSLERIDGAHEDNKLLNSSLISEVKDLDYSEAILDLNTQMAALQATQMTYSKIQNLSLFKMI